MGEREEGEITEGKRGRGDNWRNEGRGDNWGMGEKSEAERQEETNK